MLDVLAWLAGVAVILFAIAVIAAIVGNGFSGDGRFNPFDNDMH